MYKAMDQRTPQVTLVVFIPEWTWAYVLFQSKAVFCLFNRLYDGKEDNSNDELV